MTAPHHRLDAIKDRWVGSDVEPLDVAISENRKWALVLAHSGTADERILAKVVDGDDASRFANAPADVAHVLSVVEAQAGQIAKVRELAEEWRYKGEFGWGAWQEGHGPDPEGTALDHASSQLRAALAPEGPEA